MTSSFAIQRLVEVCRRQHKALSTERTYALWLKDYCRFIARLDPGLDSERKIEAFLTMLRALRDMIEDGDWERVVVLADGIARAARSEIKRTSGGG